MKIVAWNCQGNLAGKASAMLALNADIYVLSEVREDHANVLGTGYVSSWFGLSGAKGLAMVVRNGIQTSVELDSSFRHMALMQVKAFERCFSLIGVWTMKFDGYYVSALQNGLDEVLPKISAENTIVTGDFNASPVFDGGPRSRYRFETINQRLNDKDLSSAWHATHTEEFGEESKATHFHQRKRESRFHIDYMYVSPDFLRTLQQFQIGDYDDWGVSLSDHMPLIAEFDMNAMPFRPL